jgi:hypothetical protein
MDTNSLVGFKRFGHLAQAKRWTEEWKDGKWDVGIVGISDDHIEKIGKNKEGLRTGA